MTKLYHVVMKTTLGDITLELDHALAPNTVDNFIALALAAHYDGTIFHRTIPNFMIQGGGFTLGPKKSDLLLVDTASPAIENEAANEVKNLKYSVAMARTNDPHSATNQFFINTKDNDFLNFQSRTPQGWGYCVFGKVIDGFDVVDAIEKTETGTRGFHSDVPVNPVVILSTLVDSEPGVTDVALKVVDPLTGDVLGAGSTEVTAELPPESSPPDHDFVDHGAEPQDNAGIEELPEAQEVEATPAQITPLATPLVPSYSEDRAQYFVDATVLPPWTENVAGRDITTSALKFGQHFDLLGISQTQSLVDSGVYDPTDTLDSNIRLANLYVGFETDDSTPVAVVRIPLFNEYNQPDVGSLFANVGSPRHVSLNAALHIANVKERAVVVAGSLPDTVITGQTTLSATVYGMISLETGEIRVDSSGWEFGDIVCQDGQPRLNAWLVGYDLRAARVNYNRHPKMDEAAAVGRDQLERFVSAFEAEAEKFEKITTHEVEGAASNLVITVRDKKNAAGANNHYRIDGFSTATHPDQSPGSFQIGADIFYQAGPIPDVGNNGVTIEAQVATIIHRLAGFQDGPYPSAYNELALTHFRAGLDALKARTADRVARQVEGQLKS